MGGDQKFVAKLDEFFTLDAKSGDVNGNASGFIGQYAHGNEPSYHVVYLYDFTSQPWKAQFYSDKIMRELYNSEIAHKQLQGKSIKGELLPEIGAVVTADLSGRGNQLRETEEERRRKRNMNKKYDRKR